MTLITKALNPSTVWAVPEQFRSIYSHATEASGISRLLFISGQLGIDPNGHLPAEFQQQVTLAMNNVEALLTASGLTTANLVKLTYFLTRASDAPSLGAARRERWSRQEPPSVTTIVVSALARPEYLIEIEAVAAA